MSPFRVYVCPYSARLPCTASIPSQLSAPLLARDISRPCVVPRLPSHGDCSWSRARCHEFSSSWRPLCSLTPPGSSIRDSTTHRSLLLDARLDFGPVRGRLRPDGQTGVPEWLITDFASSHRVRAGRSSVHLLPSSSSLHFSPIRPGSASLGTAAPAQASHRRTVHLPVPFGSSAHRRRAFADSNARPRTLSYIGLKS